MDERSELKHQKNEADLTRDEKDLVAGELFSQMLDTLEGTNLKTELSNFMLPDLDLEDPNVNKINPNRNLEELKAFLVRKGVVTSKELDEKLKRIINERLPDLKLEQEMNQAANEPKRQETLRFLEERMKKHSPKEE